MPTGASMGDVGRCEISFWARSISCGSKFLEVFSSIRFLLIAFVPDGTRVGWERQFVADELQNARMRQRGLRDQLGGLGVGFDLVHILATGDDRGYGWMF